MFTFGNTVCFKKVVRVAIFNQLSLQLDDIYIALLMYPVVCFLLFVYFLALLFTFCLQVEFRKSFTAMRFHRFKCRRPYELLAEANKMIDVLEVDMRTLQVMVVQQDLNLQRNRLRLPFRISPIYLERFIRNIFGLFELVQPCHIETSVKFDPLV